jgi:hypothetical protein
MPTLALQKIKNITQKIVELKHTQEKLQQQIELKIISLLKSEKAFAIDFAILYGAIYELTQKLKKNDSFDNLDPDHPQFAEMANWRHLGINLLQKSQVKNTEKNKKN